MLRWGFEKFTLEVDEATEIVRLIKPLSPGGNHTLVVVIGHGRNSTAAMLRDMADKLDA